MSSLSSLNLNKMIVSPLDQEVKKKFYKITGEVETDIDQTALAKYILLMYDPNSPLIELIDDYWSRKYEALELSGFKIKGGKFEPKIEEIALGKNNTVNDLIISWLIYVAKPNFTHMIFLCEALIRYTRQSEDGINDEKITPTDVKAVSEIMDKMTKVIKEWTFANKDNETKDFLERLYYKTHQELLKIRPEHYASRLTNGETLDEDCPYGNYKVDKLKFAGAKIPADKPKKIEKTEKPKTEKSKKRGRPRG